MMHSICAPATRAAPGEADAGFNLCSLVLRHAERTPHRLALAQASGRDGNGRFRYTTRTFSQMRADIERLSHGLHAAGLGKGSKALLLVAPGLDMPAIVFALLRIGAVPVIVDPAMGLRRMRRCIRQVAPDAVIAPPLVLWLRPLLGSALRSVKCFISTRRLMRPAAREGEAFPTAPEPGAGTDLAAIFFTSGSTGAPKPVEMQHHNLAAMIEHFAAAMPQQEVEPQDVEPQDVALAAFPIYTLIAPCLGQSCVIPDRGSIHPMRFSPANLLQTIEDFGITTAFASPVVWERLARHCHEHGVNLPSLRRCYTGGAPIPTVLVRRLTALLPNGVMHTPYGATEVSPISTISAQEILHDTARLTAMGKGTCVGHVAPGLSVRIIAITHETLADWRAVTLLQQGAIGEIVVRGPTVSLRYHNAAAATAAAKICAEDPAEPYPVWHRIGDAGYFDEQGRLWFCGRLRDAVELDGQRYFSVPAEEVLNAEPEVRRAALVPVTQAGQTQLAMVIEFHPAHRGSWDAVKQRSYRDRLVRLGYPVRHLWSYPRGFPVDRRHNSKIDHRILARWAQGQLDRGHSL